jgi:hypothetical protein
MQMCHHLPPPLTDGIQVDFGVMGYVRHVVMPAAVTIIGPFMQPVILSRLACDLSEQDLRELPVGKVRSLILLWRHVIFRFSS